MTGSSGCDLLSFGYVRSMRSICSHGQRLIRIEGYFLDMPARIRESYRCTVGPMRDIMSLRFIIVLKSRSKGLANIFIGFS